MQLTSDLLELELPWRDVRSGGWCETTRTVARACAARRSSSRPDMRGPLRWPMRAGIHLRAAIDGVRVRRQHFPWREVRGVRCPNADSSVRYRVLRCRERYDARKCAGVALRHAPRLDL